MAVALSGTTDPCRPVKEVKIEIDVLDACTPESFQARESMARPMPGRPLRSSPVIILQMTRARPALGRPRLHATRQESGCVPARLATPRGLLPFAPKVTG